MTEPELQNVAEAACAAYGAKLIRYLGRGAFKHTFLAELGGQQAALKILKRGFEIQRLKREVDAMARCSHPNIATLFGVGEVNVGSEKYTYLIEEALAGGSLADRLKASGLLAPGEAIPLATSLASALVHLEELNLVHRDIKPDNVMFRSDGQTPVLIDFGVVRDLEQESLTASFAMLGPGTPLFASPEQLRNDKAQIGHRSDQFALGVTISYCVFGTHPYQRDGDSQIAVIERVGRNASPRADFTQQCVGHGLVALPKMVEAWPVRRYRTAKQLLSVWDTGRK
jgi:serine/threonine protein kinase